MQRLNDSRHGETLYSLLMTLTDDVRLYISRLQVMKCFWIYFA